MIENVFKSVAPAFNLAFSCNGGAIMIKHKVLFHADKYYILEFKAKSTKEEQWVIVLQQDFVITLGKQYSLVVAIRMFDHENKLSYIMSQNMYILPKGVDINTIEVETFDERIKVKFSLK